jgi:hypothetical protein
VGKPLAYLNSLMQLSFALNQGSMAEQFTIGSGPDWTVEITWGDYLDYWQLSMLFMIDS